ncbi:MAG: hypothetical protein EOP22_17920 [Hyphomicrobiales bacterium]|nr:MAG: hypothetical protein EOP22_17920 [Hyphomicrobiales bacterium]
MKPLLLALAFVGLLGAQAHAQGTIGGTRQWTLESYKGKVAAAVSAGGSSMVLYCEDNEPWADLIIATGTLTRNVWPADKFNFLFSIDEHGEGFASFGVPYEGSGDYATMKLYAGGPVSVAGLVGRARGKVELSLVSADFDTGDPNGDPREYDIINFTARGSTATAK